MRFVRVAVVFLVASSLQCGVSYAVVDWLDKLSGPGPFTGLVFQYRFACLSAASDQSDFGHLDGASRFRPGEKDLDPEVHFLTFQSPFARSSGLIPIKPATEIEDTDKPRANVSTFRHDIELYRIKKARRDCDTDTTSKYLAFTFGHFWSKENTLFPDSENDRYQVGLQQYEVAYGIRLNRSLDLLTSAGIAVFQGDVFPSFTRMSITPVSFDFAPFAIRDDTQRNRAIKFSLAFTMFAPGFEGSDFCRDDAACATMRPFQSRWEFIPRLSLKVDPVVFLKPAD
jgi:hypothetical protein